MRDRDPHPENAEHAQREQQNHHRRDAASRAAHRTGQPVHDAQQPVERAEVVHRQRAKADDRRVVGE